MQLVSFRNRVYSVKLENKNNKVVASIPVNGAVGEGDTEENAILNLRKALGKMESKSNEGNLKMLLD